MSWRCNIRTLRCYLGRNFRILSPVPKMNSRSVLVNVLQKPPEWPPISLNTGDDIAPTGAGVVVAMEPGVETPGYGCFAPSELGIGSIA